MIKNNQGKIHKRKILVIECLILALAIGINVSGIFNTNLKAGNLNFKIVNSKDEAQVKVNQNNSNDKIEAINSDFQAHFVKGTSVILKNNGKYYYNQGYYTTYNKNGKVVYCLNPYILAQKVKAEKDINDGEVFQKLGKTKTNKIKKILKVTNGLYQDTKDENYLIAGQVEVWKTIGVEIAEVNTGLNKYIEEITDGIDKVGTVADDKYLYLDTKGQDLVEYNGDDENTDNGGNNDEIDEISLKFIGDGSKAIDTNSARGELSIKRTIPLKTVKVELSKVDSKVVDIESYELTPDEVNQLNNNDIVEVLVGGLESDSEYNVKIIEDGDKTTNIGDIYTDKEEATGSLKYISNSASSLTVSTEVNDSQKAVNSLEIAAINEEGEETTTKIANVDENTEIQGLKSGEKYELILKADEQIDNPIYGGLTRGKVLARSSQKYLVGSKTEVSFATNGKDSITENKVQGKVQVDINEKINGLEVVLTKKNTKMEAKYMASETEIAKLNSGEEVKFTIDGLESDTEYDVKVIRDLERGKVSKESGNVYTDKKEATGTLEYISNSRSELVINADVTDLEKAISSSQIIVIDEKGEEKAVKIVNSGGEIIVDGLKPGKTYQLELRAIEQINNEHYGGKETKILAKLNNLKVGVADKLEYQENAKNSIKEDKVEGKITIDTNKIDLEELEVSLVKKAKFFDKRDGFKENSTKVYKFNDAEIARLKAGETVNFEIRNLEANQEYKIEILSNQKLKKMGTLYTDKKTPQVDAEYIESGMNSLTYKFNFIDEDHALSDETNLHIVSEDGVEKDQKILTTDGEVKIPGLEEDTEYTINLENLEQIDNERYGGREKVNIYTTDKAKTLSVKDIVNVVVADDAYLKVDGQEMYFDATVVDKQKVLADNNLNIIVKYTNEDNKELTVSKAVTTDAEGRIIANFNLEEIVHDGGKALNIGIFGNVKEEDKTINEEIWNRNIVVPKKVLIKEKEYYTLSGCEAFMGMGENKIVKHILYPNDDNYTIGKDFICDKSLKPNKYQPISNYKGDFNGQNHTIGYINIDLPEENNVGLFKELEGEVSNVTFDHLEIAGKDNVGGVIGTFTNTKTREIENLGVTNSKIVGDNYVGGIVGNYSEGDTTGKEYTKFINPKINNTKVIENGTKGYVGGFAGNYINKKSGEDGTVNIENIEMENNYIYGQSTLIGGVIGYSKVNLNKGYLKDNIVTGPNGLMVGGVSGQSLGTIENFKIDGIEISGAVDCGAIAGENYGNTNYNEIQNAQISVFSNDGGVINGESFPKTENNYNKVENSQVYSIYEGGIGIGLNKGEMKGNEVEGLVSRYKGNGHVEGGIVGRNTDTGVMEDNVFHGKVEGDFNVGGIVGCNEGLMKNNSAEDVDVTGNQGIGGEVGQNLKNGIIESSGKRNVLVKGETNVGGVVGEAIDDGEIKITGKELTGEISGETNVGGLIGYIESGSVELINSYNNEEISGKENVGGLIGDNIGFGTYITNSYYSGDIQGEEYIGGLVGKNENKLQIQNSFYYPKTKINTNIQRYQNPIKLIGQSIAIENTYTKIYSNMINYLETHENVTYNEINEVNKDYYNRLSDSERTTFKAGFINGDNWSIKGMIDNIDLISNEEANAFKESIDSSSLVNEDNAEIILEKEMVEEIKNNTNKEKSLSIDDFLNSRNKEDKYEYQSTCWKEDKTSDFPLVYEGEAENCQVTKKHISDKEVNAKIVVNGTNENSIKANNAVIDIAEDSIEDITSGAIILTNLETGEERKIPITDNQKVELNKKGKITLNLELLQSDETYQIGLDLKTAQGIGYLQYTPLKITTDKVAAKVNEFKVSSAENGIAVKLNITDKDKAIENNQVHVKLLKGSSVVADKIIGSEEDMIYFMNGDEYNGNELTLTPGEKYRVRIEYNYQIEPEYATEEKPAQQYLDTTIPEAEELEDLKYTLEPQEDMVNSITADSVQGVLDLQKDEDVKFITSQNQIVDSVQVSMIEENSTEKGLRKLFPKVVTKKISINNGRTLIRMEDLKSNTTYKLNLEFMTTDNNLVKADTYEIQTDKKTPVVKTFEEIANSDGTYSINYEIDDEDNALNDLKLLTNSGSYTDKEQNLDVSATTAAVTNVTNKADFKMGITGSYETDKYHAGEDNQTNKKLLFETNGKLAYKEIHDGIHTADTELAIKIKDPINGIHSDGVDLNISVSDNVKDQLTEVDIDFVNKSTKEYKLTEEELNTLKTKGNIDIRVNNLTPNTMYQIQCKLVRGFSTITPDKLELPEAIITDKATPEVRVMNSEVHSDKINLGVKVTDDDQAIVNNYLTYKLIREDGSEVTQLADTQTENIEFRDLDINKTYKLEISGDVAANNPQYEPVKETTFYTKEYHTIETKQPAEVKLGKDTGIIAGEDVFKIVVNVKDIDHVIQDNHLKVTLRYQNGIMPMYTEETIVYEKDGENKINIPLDRLKYNGHETLGFSISGEVEESSGIEEKEFIKADGIEIVHQRKEDDGIYLDIDTCGNLEAIGKKVNYVEYPTDGKYDIVNNLDCAGVDKIETFAGEMNGNNKTISNVDITEVGKNVGLIGTNSGTIKNVQIIDPKVSGSTNVGGLVGENTGKLENIKVVKGKSGAQITGNSEVGGLVGENKGDLENIVVSGVQVKGNNKGENIGGVVGTSDKIITNYNNIYGENLKISGNNNIGGLIGSNTNGKLKNLKVANINIVGNSDKGTNIGGLIGNNENAKLENVAINAVTARGEAFVGGLVGSNINSDISTITENEIDVNANGDDIGGIAGVVEGSKLEHIKTNKINVESQGNNIGGLIGENKDSLISNIESNEIDVKGSGNNIGGIVGSNIRKEEKNTVDNVVTVSEVNMKDTKVEQTEETEPSEVKENYGIIAGNNSGDIENIQGENLKITTDNANNVGAIGLNKGNVNSINLDNVDISASSGINIGGIIGKQLGEMKDITITNSNVKGNVNVGGIVGNLNGGLEYNQAEVNVEGTEKVGGIVGSDLFAVDKSVDNSTNKSNKIKCINANKNFSEQINTVTGVQDVGGIIGYNHNLIVDSTTINKKIVTGTQNVGGIAGTSVGDAKLNGTTNKGLISGNDYIGGIVGNLDGNLAKVENTENIEGHNYVGGIAGANIGTITEAKNTGEIKGNNYVGSLVGASKGKILNSYAINNIEGTTYTGGLVGKNNSIIENCYFTGGVSVPKEDESIAEYIGNIVGSQIKDTADDTVGSEKNTFYDPVYFRKEAGEVNVSYGYSYNDFVGQAYEETQSYLAYKNEMNNQMKEWLSYNPNATIRMKKNQLNKEAKNYLSKLTTTDKDKIIEANNKNDKWYISDNSINSVIYSDKEANLLGIKTDTKNTIVNSKESESGLSKIAGKYILSTTIGQIYGDEIEPDNTINNTNQIEFYAKDGAIVEENFNPDIWDMEHMDGGSSEPIKFLDI